MTDGGKRTPSTGATTSPPIILPMSHPDRSSYMLEHAYSSAQVAGLASSLYFQKGLCASDWESLLQSTGWLADLPWDSDYFRSSRN